MTDQLPADALAVLKRLAAGQIDPGEAAAGLLALNLSGVAVASDAFSEDERRTLDAVMPAVRWEMAKRSNAKLPDAPPGSPEYEAWRARVPRIVGPPSPGAPSN